VETGATVHSGPQFASPVHLRCDYDDGTSIEVRDVAPLIWTLLVVGGGLLVVRTVWAVLVMQGRRP
jgi:hypothetical protein